MVINLLPQSLSFYFHPPAHNGPATSDDSVCCHVWMYNLSLGNKRNVAAVASGMVWIYKLLSVIVGASFLFEGTFFMRSQVLGFSDQMLPACLFFLFCCSHTWDCLLWPESLRESTFPWFAFRSHGGKIWTSPHNNLLSVGSSDFYFGEQTKAKTNKSFLCQCFCDMTELCRSSSAL